MTGVGIRGPHIRGRDRPVHERVPTLHALYGQSKDPWFRWKAWQRRLRHRAVSVWMRPLSLAASQQQQRSKDSVMLMSEDSTPGNKRSSSRFSSSCSTAVNRSGVTAAPAEGLMGRVPGVTALTMDPEGTLDLDLLDEGITAEELAWWVVVQHPMAWFNHGGGLTCASQAGQRGWSHPGMLACDKVANVELLHKVLPWSYAPQRDNAGLTEPFSYGCRCML
jgi:hypothetical protein